MTALELRLLGYGVGLLLIVSGAFYAGHHVASVSYEAQIAADKLAQDAALQAAQQRVIDAQTARAAAEQKAQQDHETLVQADNASRDAVLSGVRGLESALHLSAVSAAVDHSGQSGAATSVTPSAQGSSASVDQLNAAVERAIQACQHDSAELAGILELAPITQP